MMHLNYPREERKPTRIERVREWCRAFYYRNQVGLGVALAAVSMLIFLWALNT